MHFVNQAESTVDTYRNPEHNPTFKNMPISLNEIFAKGAFLSEVRPPIPAAVHAVMLGKKH